MKLGYGGGFPFSLAQAFTPGTQESNGSLSAPFRGLPSPGTSKPPKEGYTLYWIFNPGVNAWAKRKTAPPMFPVRNLDE